MTENMGADVQQSRQAVFAQCRPKYPIFDLATFLYCNFQKKLDKLRKVC
jgi:hypothetical protein